MNLDFICRVCLKEGTIQPIFNLKKTKGDDKVSCLDMLLICAPIPVHQDDGFPQNICTQCFKKLSSAYKFRRLCENSYSRLLKYAAENVNNSVPIKEEKCDIIADTIKEPKDESSCLQQNVVDVVKNEIIPIEYGSINYNEKEEAIFDEDCVSSNNLDSDDDYLKPKKKNKAEIKKSKKTKIDKNKQKSNINKDGKRVRRIRKCNYVCSLCPKAFETQSLLLAHHDKHIGIKRYFCELCKKWYRSEKNHTNMHKKTFDFKCEVCSKEFITRTKYKVHMETHNQNREKIICGLNGCTKLFMSTGGLERHRSLHDGLKNFVCHICSKRFIDKYLLAVHIRRHTNDKPFPCRFCEKKFVQSSARLTHEQRHKNIRNFKCTQCEKSFVCNATLRRHMLCHTKVMPEECRFCAKRFSQRDSRRRHEAVIHGVSEGGEKDTDKNYSNAPLNKI